MRLYLLSLIFLAVGASCGKKESGGNQLQVVARAGSDELDIDEFNAIYLPGNLKDSAYNTNKAIEKWATEALFYQEALDKLADDEVQIGKQVEDYRRSLVNHIYQTRVVEANLDTVISPEEIEEYYNTHRDNFILRDNIVKVNYLKVNLKSPALPKIRKLLNSTQEKDRQQLDALCSQNAENYFLNDSTWLFIDDIRKEIPSLKDHEEYSFSKGRIMEFSDEDYFYYLKVKDVMVKNSFSPLNFEVQNIRKFILNNRKTQLVSQYKQLLLEKAKASKSYSIMIPAR